MPLRETRAYVHQKTFAGISTEASFVEEDWKHNGQRWETTQIFINKRTDKQIVVSNRIVGLQFKKLMIDEI